VASKIQFSSGVSINIAGGKAAAQAAVRRAGGGVRERASGARAAERGNGHHCDTNAPRRDYYQRPRNAAVLCVCGVNDGVL